jgi:hypothetical protein
MRRNHEPTVRNTVTLLLCIASGCASEANAPKGGGPGALGVAGSPAMDDLFVTRTPASSVPVVTKTSLFHSLASSAVQRMPNL